MVSSLQNTISTIFQSTHPLRDATIPLLRTHITSYLFQSTHPLRDATMYKIKTIRKFEQFQSTHPLRDATVTYCFNIVNSLDISIHAPLTGCDDSVPSMTPKEDAISIHAPLTGCDLYSLYLSI